MALATLPPVIESRDFTRTLPVRLATEPYWCDYHTIKEADSSWKSVAFSKIASLEHGKNIAGAGNYRPSERAAGQLRLYISKISVRSLPIPSVLPLSGEGILLTWRSGGRTVEIASFADGEIVTEALEHNETNEELSQKDAASLLGWLVDTAETQRSNATAR